MRGVVSCGMADELARRGGYDAFDTVYGTSAGAFIGSFFTTRQMHLGPSVYIDDLPNSQFIAWRRLFLGRPVVNLHFLINEGRLRIKPLDWRRVVSSAVPLKIVVSSLHHGDARLLHDFQSESDLFEALRGSATVPYLAGLPVPYHGDMLFDGGIFEPFPYQSAITDGCTHVVVLSSRPQGRYCRPPAPLISRIVERRLRRLSPATANASSHDPLHYKHAAQHIDTASLHPGIAPFIYGAHLAHDVREISRLEKNRTKPRAGAAVIAGLLPTAKPLTVLSALSTAR